MILNLPKDIMLPPDWKFKGEVTVELETFLAQLSRSIEEYFRETYFDVKKNAIKIVRTATAADLSGSAETLVAFHTELACTLEKATLLYTEASSGDAGITLEIGKESDRNYYYTGTSEVSKALWYSLDVTLLQNDIAAGDTVTLYSPGSKTGTGAVMLIMEYSIN